MHGFTVLLIEAAYRSAVCATLDILAVTEALAGALQTVAPRRLMKTLAGANPSQFRQFG